MYTREAYKQKYEAQLKIWGAKIDGITARSAKATAQAKIDVAPHVNAIHDNYAAAKAKLEQLAQATDDKWDDAAKDADRVWQDFKASVEGAFMALRPTKKKI
jgi:hypothetical protein